MVSPVQVLNDQFNRHSTIPDAFEQLSNKTALGKFLRRLSWETTEIWLALFDDVADHDLMKKREEAHDAFRITPEGKTAKWVSELLDSTELKTQFQNSLSEATFIGMDASILPRMDVMNEAHLGFLFSARRYYEYGQFCPLYRANRTTAQPGDQGGFYNTPNGISWRNPDDDFSVNCHEQKYAWEKLIILLPSVEAKLETREATIESVAPPPAPSTLNDIPQYVTMDQMAAMLNRAKRTVERKINSKSSTAPRPDVEGGGGKAHEWKWSAIRPWLETAFNKQLPKRFPSRMSAS